MAQAVGSRRIDLYWSAAAHDGGSPVTGYRIEVSADRGATWRVLRAHTGSTLTMFEHTGLEPQNTRHYRVYAIQLHRNRFALERGLRHHDDRPARRPAYSERSGERDIADRPLVECARLRRRGSDHGVSDQSLDR